MEFLLYVIAVLIVLVFAPFVRALFRSATQRRCPWMNMLHSSLERSYEKYDLSTGDARSVSFTSPSCQIIYTKFPGQQSEKIGFHMSPASGPPKLHVTLFFKRGVPTKWYQDGLMGLTTEDKPKAAALREKVLQMVA